jgi:hypothetical protein
LNPDAGNRIVFQHLNNIGFILEMGTWVLITGVQDRFSFVKNQAQFFIFFIHFLAEAVFAQSLLTGLQCHPLKSQGL